jgi:hypothetical protein
VGLLRKLSGIDLANRARYTAGWQRPWTMIPEGVEPKIGQRIMVGTAGGGNSLRSVLWDEPAPELPPMQFPKVPGGDDPKVMLEQLEAMTQDGRLNREGYERAKAYLESGGWPDPANAS